MVEAIITLVAALGGGLVGAVKGIAFVRSGERALMLRFDKAREKNGVYSPPKSK